MQADGRGTHPDELPGRAASVANRMAQFAEGPAANGAAHERSEHGHHDDDMLPQVHTAINDLTCFITSKMLEIAMTLREQAA